MESDAWNDFPPALLNAAMELSLAFGPELRRPIHERLRAAFPALDEAEAARIDTMIRAERDVCLALVADSVWDKVVDETATKAAIRARIHWVDDRTLGHLWSQGVYLAMK